MSKLYPYVFNEPQDIYSKFGEYMDDVLVSYRRAIQVPIGVNLRESLPEWFELKNSEQTILLLLFFEKEEKCSIKKLADQAMLSYKNMYRYSGDLEMRGYIIRYPNPENRKYVFAELTDKAHLLIVKKMELSCDCARRCMSDSLGEEKTARAASLAKELSELLAEASPRFEAET